MSKELYKDLCSDSPSEASLQTLAKVLEELDQDYTNVEVVKVKRIYSDALFVSFSAAIIGTPCEVSMNVATTVLEADDPILAARKLRIEKYIQALTVKAEKALNQHNLLVKNLDDAKQELSTLQDAQEVK